jgi:hypothetical protein
MKKKRTSLLFRGLATTAMLAAAASVAFTFAGGLAATTGLASCIATDTYVYTAQKYDPTNDCVGTYKAIEVVTGSGASATCAPACLMVGDDLFVSTLCPPLPTIATAVDADAGTCTAALAAAATGGTCDVPAPTEGGTAEGGADADADTDADADGVDAAEVDAAEVDAAEAGGIKDAGDAG